MASEHQGGAPDLFTLSFLLQDPKLKPAVRHLHQVVDQLRGFLPRHRLVVEQEAPDQRVGPALVQGFQVLWSGRPQP
jgi:hypothetical protein